MLESRPPDHGDARDILLPHLADDERFHDYATATLMPDQDESNVLVDGVLFTTDQRLVFWALREPAPVFYIGVSEVIGAVVDAQPFAGDFRMIVIRTRDEEDITFITERHLAEDIARPYVTPVHVDEMGQDSAARSKCQGHRSSSNARENHDNEPNPAGSSVNEPAPGMRLPPTRSPIPLVALTAHTSRTLAPDAFRRAQVPIQSFMAHASSHSTDDLGEEMDGYIDELARTIRDRMSAGRIAPCPDDGLHAAFQFGAAIAISERQSGWTDATSTHPLVHAALFLIQRGLVDDFGLGASLPLEASYRCARAGRFVDGLFPA